MESLEERMNGLNIRQVRMFSLRYTVISHASRVCSMLLPKTLP